jgi:hypothetical protein
MADFSNRPESGLVIYEGTAREVANQVAVRATQKAIRAGGVTERGDVNNLNTRPITPVPRPNGQQKGGGRGGGKGGDGKSGGGGVKPSGNPCCKKAYEGSCGDPQCLHLHDKATMEVFKAKMGASFEDKRKRWLGAGGIGREAGPPSAPKQRAHATIKGEADKDTNTKGTKYTSSAMAPRKVRAALTLLMRFVSHLSQSSLRTSNDLGKRLSGWPSALEGSSLGQGPTRHPSIPTPRALSLCILALAMWLLFLSR